jgi:putative endonuclease
MRYYTYILKSEKNGDYYIGSTEDVIKRLELHNKGRVKSTKAYKPWILLETHEFVSRSEAFRQEMFLKTHQQKNILKNKYR